MPCTVLVLLSVSISARYVAFYSSPSKVIRSQAATRTIVDYKSMTRDQLALAAVEIDISGIPEGVGKTFEWRGKPVFVRHRTQAEIDRERAVNHTELRHPETDEQRAPVDPKWVVTLGVCTHLGCVPIGAFALSYRFK